MGTALLNSRLSLSWPEDFRELTQEEIRQMNTTAEPPQFCIMDPQRHMTVNIAWKQASSLQAFMLNAKSVATEMEKQASRALKAGNAYKLDKFLLKDAGGIQGAGFSYYYTAADTAMCSESYVFEVDKVFYYLYFYYRQEQIEAGRAAAEEILTSIRWQ